MANDVDWVLSFLLEHICSVVELINLEILDAQGLHNFREVLLLVAAVLVLQNHLIYLFKVAMLSSPSYSSLHHLISVQQPGGLVDGIEDDLVLAADAVLSH